MPMISRRRIIFATVLSCCCLGAADEACSQSDPSASERQETLKLAVIGASASAGFGIVVEVEKASPPETDETVTSDTPTAPRTVKRMIKLIVARTGITAEDAYRLCSLAVDLRVTQVVNRSKGIHAMIARELLERVAN